MSEIPFGIPSKGPIDQSFDLIPPDFKRYIRDGFYILSRMDQKTWSSLIELATNAVSPFDDIALEAQEILGAEADDLSRMLPALRLVLGVLAFREETSQDFVGIAVKSGLFDRDISDRIQRFADFAVAKKESLSQQLRDSALQHKILPSLSTFDVSVDLRLRFNGKNFVNGVPVAVIHIDTDVNNREVWFQMSPQQVKTIASRLTQIGEQLAAAEQLLKKLV